MLVSNNSLGYEGAFVDTPDKAEEATINLQVKYCFCWNNNCFLERGYNCTGNRWTLG